MMDSDQITNQAISAINSLFTISKEHGYFCVLNRGKRGDLVMGFISHLWPNQVIYYKDGMRIGDAVCQYGSYGYQQGLFEVMGDALLTPEEREKDSVVGYLRLEEVLDRLEKIYGKC